MKPMIRVRAIGTSELRVGRGKVKPDSAVLFALVLYLACNASQGVARARVLDLFWPGVAEVSRRHALRQLLYRLRRNGVSLALDGDELEIAAAEVDSDLSALLDTDWPETASAEAVIAAASVLPGYSPALPEQYLEWLDDLRSRIGAQYRRAVMRHLAAARDEGRWSDVDEWSRRCLAADPLNEEATLALAEAAAMSGSKTRALGILDEYLWELGPREKVIGLPAKVLKRRISEQPPGNVSRYAGGTPLVGRAEETRRLNELLGGTLAGHRASVLLVGAPGIGKTALTQEIVDSALMRGWRSISARLQASDLHRPLAAFVDLFSVLLHLPGALGSAPASLTQLRRLTQHGVEPGIDAPRSQEAEAVQERIRVAALDLFAAVCDEGPLVVVLEDLHWADASSMLLLQHMLDRTRDLPIFWLLTARPEVRFTELRETLPEELVETMRMGPLSARDSVTLFRLLTDRWRPADQATVNEFSAALTGGNPFFIREVARHYTETGSIRSLPGSLRALIHDRVARLPRVSQHVLHTCAILGRYSTVPRIASVLEMGTAELLACLEDLDAVGILGAGKDADALAMHDLWQEELLSSLRAASRQLIHHRCGAVLEMESRQTRSASMMWEASRHLIESGAQDRALSLLEECAQHLLDNGLPVDAAKTFELAFNAAATDAERFRALSGRISALHRAAKWSELSEVIGPAIELSERCSGAPSGHSELELLETELLWRTEVDSNSSLQRALACARDGAASLAHRASAGLTAARTASNLARWSDLEFVHKTAKALPVDSLEGRANILAVETIFHTEIGSLDAALEAANRLISTEREMGSVCGLSRALRFGAHPLRCLGQFDSAIAMLTEALELAEKLHLVEDACSAADVIATIHVERNDIGAAEFWLLQAEGFANRIGAEYARNSINSLKAIVALASNEPESVESLIETDPAKHGRDPLVKQRVVNLSILSRLFVARNDAANLEIALRLLRRDLVLLSPTCRKDYAVASLALGLVEQGKSREASACVRNYLTHDRRDRSDPSSEIAHLLSLEPAD